MKEMKGIKALKLLLLSSVLGLSGCFHQVVNSFDIHRSIKFCGGIENVVEIKAHFLGYEQVGCKDGTFEVFK